MADPKPLNRQQLATICNNDPEAIRLMERLFQVAGQLLPDEIAAMFAVLNARIDAVSIVANEALALAQEIEAEIAGLIGGGASGVATLTFGAAPGSGVTFVTVTGQADIEATAKVRAWVQATPSASYNADEYALILAGRLALSAGAIVPGVGFTIYGETELRLTGAVTVHWEWSN